MMRIGHSSTGPIRIITDDCSVGDDVQGFVFVVVLGALTRPDKENVTCSTTEIITVQVGQHRDHF